jgi:hypothetical protein
MADFADTVAEQSAFGHGLVGMLMRLRKPPQMWIVERSIAFSPLIAPKMAYSDARMCYILASWR